MVDRFAPGARVRTRRTDPPHHTRLPRYARGAVGTVVEPQGRHPLADDRARGLTSAPQTVYAVRFPAGELFGKGDHAVVLDLWEDYLSPAEGGRRRGGAAGMSGDHAGSGAALAARVRHVEGLLEQHGLVDSVELDRALTAFLSKGSPAAGARLVVRAWLDEASAGACSPTPTPRCPRWGCRWAAGCRSNG